MRSEATARAAPAAAPPAPATRPIPLAVPHVGPAEAANLLECVRSGWVSTVGPFVERLEREVAAEAGAAGAAAVAAGTMGLHVALVALGVGRDDLVLLPSYTFIASANAVSQAGAVPWLVDIRASDWTLDPEALATLLATETARGRDGVVRRRACGRRVAAVMPVYTLGTPAEMDAIGAIAAAHGLPVVADAAASIGATYRGRPLGALAALSVFSFNGNKTITSGGGGMVIGRERALVDRVRHLGSTARVGADYRHDAIGFNYRMTNVEAAIGVAQLARLPAFLAAKARIRRTYDEALGARPGLAPFPAPVDATGTCWLSGVVLTDDCPWTVAGLAAALGRSGIQARPFWCPVHLQTPYRGAPCAPLPVTEALWSRVLTLPCSTSLTPDDQARVIETLEALLAAGPLRPWVRP